MPKQRSEQYVTIVHPKHGEKKTLDWVAESLVKKGWTLREEPKKTTTANPEKVKDGNVN